MRVVNKCEVNERNIGSLLIYSWWMGWLSKSIFEIWVRESNTIRNEVKMSIKRQRELLYARKTLSTHKQQQKINNLNSKENEPLWSYLYVESAIKINIIIIRENIKMFFQNMRMTFGRTITVYCALHMDMQTNQSSVMRNKSWKSRYGKTTTAKSHLFGFYRIRCATVISQIAVEKVENLQFHFNGGSSFSCAKAIRTW